MKKIRKGVVLILALAVVLTSVTPAVAAGTSDNDIDSHWASTYIYQALRGGFADMHGGLFEPDRAITRAEFAHMVTAMLGLTRTENNMFTDVTEDNPYVKDIQAAVAAGILKGKETSKFYPDGAINREEAAAIIGRAVPGAGMLDEECLKTFHDADKIGSWAREGLAICKNKGYIIGNELGYMNPQGQLTRAEAVKILCVIQNSEDIVREPVTLSGQDPKLENKIVVGDVNIASTAKGTVLLNNNVIFGNVTASGGERLRVQDSQLPYQLIIRGTPVSFEVTAVGRTEIASVRRYELRSVVNQALDNGFGGAVSIENSFGQNTSSGGGGGGHGGGSTSQPEGMSNAQRVTQMIEALPDPETIEKSLVNGYKDSVWAAKKRFDQLTPAEQGYVSAANKAKLDALTAKVDQFLVLMSTVESSTVYLIAKEPEFAWQCETVQLMQPDTTKMVYAIKADTVQPADVPNIDQLIGVEKEVDGAYEIYVQREIHGSTTQTDDLSASGLQLQLAIREDLAGKAGLDVVYVAPDGSCRPQHAMVARRDGQYFLEFKAAEETQKVLAAQSGLSNSGGHYVVVYDKPGEPPTGRFDTPGRVKVEKDSAKHFIVSFDPVEGAKQYLVYLTNTQSGEVNYFETKQNTLDITDYLKEGGRTYQVQVAAKASGTMATSALSGAVSFQSTWSKLSVPQQLDSFQQDGGVEITFEADPASYLIQVSLLRADTGAFIGSMTTEIERVNIKTLLSLAPNDVRQFTVRVVSLGTGYFETSDAADLPLDLDQLRLRYRAAANGAVLGETDQIVARGNDGAEVTAQASVGYHFLRWSDGVDTAVRQDKNVQNDISVSAQFEINTYRLTYTAAEHGKIEGTAGQYVQHGGNGQKVTAIADEGYEFTGWSDGVLTAARTDLDVTGDIAVTAQFARKQYTLSYVAGPNGSVLGDLAQTVYHGGSGTEVEAVPNETYQWLRWSDGVTSQKRQDADVTQNLTVTALFASEVVIVQYVANEYGTISGIATQRLQPGESSTTVTAVPKEGTRFVQWSDGVLTAERSDVDVRSNLTVTALFEPNPSTVTYLAGEHGSISGEAVQQVDYGADTKPVTAVADTHYHFTQWSDGFDRAQRIDFEVKGDKTFTAYFAANTNAVVVTGGEGSGTYAYGDTVTVEFIPAEGQTFNGWTVTSGGVQLADPSAQKTTFTMPDNVVRIQAEIIYETGGCGHGGDVPGTFFKGSGTQADPFLVETPQQFMHIDAHAGDGYYYRQENDLDFQDVEFSPVAQTTEFKGSYDGGGYSIKNLVYKDSTNEAAALFLTLDAAGEVKGVVVDASCAFEANRYAAAIAANAGTGQILNCVNKADIKAAVNAGGIVAVASIKTTKEVVRGCRNEGNITTTKTNLGMSGGIAGVASGAVTACYNTGTVTGTKQAGGIVGENNGTLTQCYNTGTVYSSINAGGVAGYNKGRVETGYNAGQVYGDSASGGMTGYNASSMSYIYNVAQVGGWKKSTGYIGGVIGYNNKGSVESSYNVGKVTGSQKSRNGGIVGSNAQAGTIQNNYYLEGTAAGAIAGADHAGKAEARSLDQMIIPSFAVLLNNSAAVWVLDASLSNPAGFQFPQLTLLPHIGFFPVFDTAVSVSVPQPAPEETLPPQEEGIPSPTPEETQLPQETEKPSPSPVVAPELSPKPADAPEETPEA